jgi:hypothetical protein
MGLTWTAPAVAGEFAKYLGTWHYCRIHKPHRGCYTLGCSDALSTFLRRTRQIVCTLIISVVLTGLMQAAYSGASTSTVGSLMQLDAVAARVICGPGARGLVLALAVWLGLRSSKSR